MIPEKMYLINILFDKIAVNDREASRAAVEEQQTGSKTLTFITD